MESVRRIHRLCTDGQGTPPLKPSRRSCHCRLPSLPLLYSPVLLENGLGYAETLMVLQRSANPGMAADCSTYEMLTIDLKPDRAI